MDDSLLQEFVNESLEHLATIETDLLALEEGGAQVDVQRVNKVFRAAHSIKGAAAFLGLGKVKELAHRAETVLDMVRSRTMVPNAEVTNILLAAFDSLRSMVNTPADSERAETAALVTSLTQLAAQHLPADEKDALTAHVELRTPATGSSVTVAQADLDRARRGGLFVYTIDYDLIHDVEREGRNVLDVFREAWESGEILDCGVDYSAAGTLEGNVGNNLPLRLVFATLLGPDEMEVVFPGHPGRIQLLANPTVAQPPEPAPAPAPRPVPVAAPVLPPPPPAPVAVPVAAVPVARPAPAGPSSSAGESTDSTLRVPVGLLEALMNLAGELVLSRNQLRAAVSHDDRRAISVADQRINQVTSELQDAIMQTRLQPMGNVLNKFPRVVRDLASTLHKDVLLDLRGKDVALDKSLIEGLSDPLTHMVRNAVDHGIELPADRVRAGKKAQGLLRIEARHEAGQVVVEIADDGKGMDPGRIAASALTKGLVTGERLASMSDLEKLALIFLPGLSTAEKVTDVSGRGVGMDVVKTNLDRLGGKVEISSQVGRGSLFRIKLPLTLAIIPSLIVSVEEERFAIPQVNVEELLHVHAEDVKRRVEVVGGAEVLLLRDKIIPLVRFADVLGVALTYVDPVTGRRELDRRGRLADRRSPRHAAREDPNTPRVPEPGSERRQVDGRRQTAASALEVVVVTTGTTTYGLVVGAFHDTEEIVVKPVGRHLKGLREYAGATILGDGTVALILDVGGVATKADVAAVAGTTRAREHAAEVDRERLEDIHALLLFHNAPEEPCAIPLESVLRIERIRPEQVERVGSRRTMQYRGASLPLVTLADTAQVKPLAEGRELAVVVSSVFGHEVGLLGAMPVDVTEAKTTVDLQTHRQKGIAGSTILRNHTTLLVDLQELVEAAYPEWRPAPGMPPPPPGSKGGPMVLLAEDSDFFRSQVRRFLVEDGFTVLDAPDGEAAWELLLAHAKDVQVVVTDVEMPRLTGLELATRIRADERVARLPILALTSLAGEEDMARGSAAGVDEYQVKLDRESLLKAVRAFVGGA